MLCITEPTVTAVGFAVAEVFYVWGNESSQFKTHIVVFVN
jgi:hypothetical protein